MKRAFATCAVVAIVASSVVMAWRVRGDAADEERRRVARSVAADERAELRERVAALEAQLARLELQAVSLASHGSASATRDAEKVSAPEPATLPPAPDAAVEERARLETVFRGGLEDPDAPLSTLASVEMKLRAALPLGSSMDHVECRANACRVEATHPDLRAYTAFAEAIQGGSAEWLPLPNQAPLVTADDGTRRLVSVTYLSRN